MALYDFCKVCSSEDCTSFLLVRWDIEIRYPSCKTDVRVVRTLMKIGSNAEAISRHVYTHTHTHTHPPTHAFSPSYDKECRKKYSYFNKQNIACTEIFIDSN
jgi:hypothetical protein